MKTTVVSFSSQRFFFDSNVRSGKEAFLRRLVQLAPLAQRGVLEERTIELETVLRREEAGERQGMPELWISHLFECCRQASSVRRLFEVYCNGYPCIPSLRTETLSLKRRCSRVFRPSRI